tara:strand:- start:433 stop:2862 length:2430 start_codon:yes stop_codon:yes gene_type:complete
MANSILRFFSPIIIVSSIGFSNEKTNTIDFSQLALKKVSAMRTIEPPIIDGKLNDEAWAKTTVHSDFLQYRPNNLAEPTFKTEVRILYDDDFIYLSFNNLDPDPEKIRSTLGRRDDWTSSFGSSGDYIIFNIDSRNNDKNGNSFGVNAANVQFDNAVTSDASGTDFETSWNAVWTSNVSINDDGWSTEIKLPFSIFQFSKNENQAWGFRVHRTIHRSQEWIFWPGMDDGLNGFVEHFGVLKGITNIPQPKNIELIPYVLSGKTISETTDNTQNLGLDIKYNISSDVTANFTFNPDFGQIEADPSVLNLSAFETGLKEKRPFFVQGSNFFKAPFGMTYSRRIGQRPRFYSPSDGDLVSRPEATTILGALKIVGHTQSGIKYGFLNAVTDEEYGTIEKEIDGDIRKDNFLIEPYSNYNTSVVQVPVLNDISSIKLISNNLSRPGETLISTSAIEGGFSLLNNALRIGTDLGTSSTSDKPNGYAYSLYLDYKNPDWWSITFWQRSSDGNFDVSDMGYQRRNNEKSIGSMLTIRRDEPKGIFLRQRFSINTGFNFSAFSGEEVTTGRDLDFFSNNTFRNYWQLKLALRLNPTSYDDQDLYRDSRAFVVMDEAWQSYQLSISTDTRKRIIFEPSFNFDDHKISGSGYRFRFKITTRPTDFLKIDLFQSRRFRPNHMQWVGIEEKINDDIDIIYANTKQWQIDSNLRVNWSFSPKMTFEAFYQPFKVDMDYLDYNRLMEEKTNRMEKIETDKNLNFKMRNKRGTFVFRWEVIRGSFLYVVYNINENRYYSEKDKEWNKTMTNSFFLKFNYYFRPN